MSAAIEAVQNEMAVMDSSGDTKYIWDVNSKDEIKAAHKAFKTLIKKGYMAYSVKDNGNKNEQIHDFDPELGKIIMIPPIQGG